MEAEQRLSRGWAREAEILRDTKNTHHQARELRELYIYRSYDFLENGKLEFTQLTQSIARYRIHSILYLLFTWLPPLNYCFSDILYSLLLPSEHSTDTVTEALRSPITITTCIALDVPKRLAVTSLVIPTALPLSKRKERVGSTSKDPTPIPIPSQTSPQKRQKKAIEINCDCKMLDD